MIPEVTDTVHTGHVWGLDCLEMTIHVDWALNPNMYLTVWVWAQVGIVLLQFDFF